jgi:hypothetical protein
LTENHFRAGDKNESPATSYHRRDLISNKGLFAVLLLSVVTLSGGQDLVPLDASSLLLPTGFNDPTALVLWRGWELRCKSARLDRHAQAPFQRRYEPANAGIMAAFEILWVYYGWLIASQPVIL